MNTVGYMAPRRPGRRHRLKQWLFPVAFPDVPDSRGVLSRQANIRVTCVLHWPDRLRLLVSGRLVVQTHIYAEHEFGEHSVGSSMHVLAPGEGA